MEYKNHTVLAIGAHIGDAELTAGALLATFECYTNNTPVFPIFESLDDGASWHLLSRIEDKEKGWGNLETVL